jgi:hypothetical protein
MLALVDVATREAVAERGENDATVVGAQPGESGYLLISGSGDEEGEIDRYRSTNESQYWLFGSPSGENAGAGTHGGWSVT